MSLIKQDMAIQPFVAEIIHLLEEARRHSARAVNAILTATYWEVGRRIVKNEQTNKDRAEYGEELIKRLSSVLTERFGRGFAKSNLYQMRTFYLAYTDIFQTLSGKSEHEKFQALPYKFTFQELSHAFPLSWSHFVLLLSSSKTCAGTNISGFLPTCTWINGAWARNSSGSGAPWSMTAGRNRSGDGVRVKRDI